MTEAAALRSSALPQSSDYRRIRRSVQWRSVPESGRRLPIRRTCQSDPISAWSCTSVPCVRMFSTREGYPTRSQGGGGASLQQEEALGLSMRLVKDRLISCQTAIRYLTEAAVELVSPLHEKLVSMKHFV